MAMKLLLIFISCIIVFIYGLPMKIAPPKPIVEKMNYTGTNPRKFAGIIGNDIIIPNFDRKNQHRGAAIHVQHKWPNNVVPYDISAITDSYHHDMIIYAMNTLMYDTGIPIADSDSRYHCINFRPRKSSDDTYLTIQYGRGCSAHLGYWANYGLTMTLEAPCYDSGTIQHELMHVLGFDHEQNRPDRDDYIDINFDNVIDGSEFNFYKHTDSQSTNLNTPYDYNSIMHYGNYFFSKNGNPTIVAKQQNIEINGHSPRLSPIDIEEVHRYYGCKQ